MMRNDLPYAPPVNGRWYKIFLENDNGTIKKTDSDIPCNIEQYEKTFYLFIDENYKMLEYMLDSVLEKTGSCDTRLQFYDGKYTITFSNIDAIDNLTIYAYCVRL